MYSIYDEQVGLLKSGTIVDYDPVTDVMEVQLNTSQAVKGNKRISIPMPAAHALFYNNGLFIGTKPIIGTPVVVGQGSGNQYYFVSFKAENLPVLPDLKLNELLIRSNDTTKISLDTNSNISIGSDFNKIHIHTGNKDQPKTNLLSFNFENIFHFSEASRQISGLIKRDLRLNKNFDQDSKLTNDSYDPFYHIIGLDPTLATNDIITGASKNPPLVEQRELIYEFQYQSGVTNDHQESLQYNTSSKIPKTDFIYPNRRRSRADLLSLTLLEPNYLMETVKGTVVDIFGNILDLNRTPLPLGKEQSTLKPDKSNNKQDSFLKIKELERKSIAYHFELNARKEFNQKSTKTSSTLDLLNIDSNADNSRLRSRFFIDIDKEGQFKINVPASSEKGNIPLLTRYENRSTYDSEDNNNPNKLLYNEDNLDIYLDSFAANPVTIGEDFSLGEDKGSISLKDDDGEIGPIDRITNAHIKHGTAHHDILMTCWTSQSSDYIDFAAGTAATSLIDIDAFADIGDIASDSIKVSGTGTPDQGGPNAGGRSGSINLDGMLEFNIGANTIDRQSLWADLAGGSVINVGRDKNARSCALMTDGNVYMQIGSFGVSGDSRFDKEPSGAFGAVLDLRVLTSGGFTHMIRCDDSGITIMSPSNLNIHIKGDINLTSDSNINLECETLTVQGRMVLKEFGGSI